MMPLDDFKRSVIVLSEEAAGERRRRYIEAFVDTTSEHYRKSISTLRTFSDGVFYEGYLWDCLKKFQSISGSQFMTEVSSRECPVMVMWDLNSRDKILIPNYWKFERHDVLVVEPGVLIDNLRHLPEDIYVYDDDLLWTLVATHEHNEEEERLFVRATQAAI
jgi:hypothetical protein